jgi:hypothetical protein
MLEHVIRKSRLGSFFRKNNTVLFRIDKRFLE